MKTGDELAGQDASADGCPDEVFRRPALEYGLRELVAVERGGVEERLAPGRGLGRELVRDGLDPDRLALRAVEIEGLHGHEIDQALKGAFEADRQLHQDRPVAQLVARSGHGP